MPYADPQRRIEYQRELRRKSSPERIARESARSTAKYYRLRRESIDAYGGSCACCGEVELVFLALDHEGGGGSKRRKAAGGGRSYLELLHREGWPTDHGIRVLCHNCNMATMNGRVCPHQAIQ